MEEMAVSLKRQRVNAWKKKFKEKIGRDHLSSIKGYVVAGNIFDVLDDLWMRPEEIQISNTDKQPKNKHDVFLYQMIRYPPASPQKRRFIG